MKKLILLACAFAFPFLLKAQDCPDFYSLMKEGNSAKDYEVAYRKYDSAEEVAYTEVQRKEAKKKKNELFQKINALRKEAEAAQKEAKTQAQIAEDAKIKVEQERQKTEVEKDNAVKALELAKVMSDSASEATKLSQASQGRVSLLIQLNDDEGLGNGYMEEKNYEKAIFYYTNAISKLEKTEIVDSSLANKKQLLVQKLERANRMFDAQNAFRLYDSLVKIGAQYAYLSYLSAANLDYGKDTLLSKLSLLESRLGRHAKIAKKVKGEEYFALMGFSTDANLLLGDNDLAKLRVRQALRRHPSDLSFIKNVGILEYAKRHNKSFLKSLSFYVGTGKVYRPQPPSFKINSGSVFNSVDRNYTDYTDGECIPTKPVWSIGLSSQIGDWISVGIEYCENDFHQFDLQNNGDLPIIPVGLSLFIGSNNYSDFRARRGSLYGLLNLVKIKNKKWKTTINPIEFQWIVGVNIFSTSGRTISLESQSENEILNKPFKLGDVKDIESIKTSEGTSLKFNYYVYPDYVDDYFYFNESATLGDNYVMRKVNWGVVTGPRVTFFPIKQLHPLGFYIEMIQNIPLAKEVSFNLANIGRRYVQKNYQNIPDANEVNQYFEEYWNYDVTYKSARYKFSSGWFLKFGLVYKM